MIELDLGVWTGTSDVPKLILIGSEEALAELARLLTATSDRVVVRLLRMKPTPPLSVALAFIEIRTEPEPKLAVRRDGDTMILAGERKALEILGANIERFARRELGIYMHVDYFPDHFYLRPDSLPLDVSWPPETS